MRIVHAKAPTMVTARDSLRPRSLVFKADIAPYPRGKICLEIMATPRFYGRFLPDSHARAITAPSDEAAMPKG